MVIAHFPGVLHIMSVLLPPHPGITNTDIRCDELMLLQRTLIPMRNESIWSHEDQGVISAKSVWEQSVGGKKSLWQNMAKIAVKSAIYGQICFK